MRDIAMCHPRLKILADQLVKQCAGEGLPVGIGETLRTVKEQDELYAQGRTRPGSIVTNAPGSTYSSQHQWGIAFDFFRNDGKGAYYDKDDFFSKVGAEGKKIGLGWGGEWKSIVDKPHLYLPDWGSTPKQLKDQYGTLEAFMKTWNPPEQTGWIQDAIGWWYRESDGGYPKNQWKLVNHHWYLFNPDGYLCTGWHRFNGSVTDALDGGGDWYFLDNTPNGELEGACWKSNEKGAMGIWYVA